MGMEGSVHPLGAPSAQCDTDLLDPPPPPKGSEMLRVPPLPARRCGSGVAVVLVLFFPPWLRALELPWSGVAAVRCLRAPLFNLEALSPLGTR